METRELFERLVTDEPPLNITGSAMRERGQQALRRRRSGVGATALVLVVVAIIAGTQILGPDQRHRGTLDPAGQPVITSLPFTSTDQVAASNQAVYQVLLAAPVGATRVTGQDSGPRGVKDGTPFGAAGSVVDYVRDNNSVELSAYTTTRRALSAEHCSADSTQKVADCTTRTLPGGAVLWTWVTLSRAASILSPGPSPSEAPFVPDTRAALLLAPDGSSITVVLIETNSDSVPFDLQAAGIGPSTTELGNLALKAAVAWRTAAASELPSNPTTSRHPSQDQSSLGTSSVAAFPFVSSGQVNAADARVMALLEAAAEPLGPRWSAGTQPSARPRVPCQPRGRGWYSSRRHRRVCSCSSSSRRQPKLVSALAMV